MLILVTWTWRTQTEKVWHSSVVSTSSISCCHQRHTHEPVGRDSLSHRINIGPTITVYLEKSLDKKSSSSQILRLCAQWEHRLDSLPAQAGSDTHNQTTPQTHTYPAACSYHEDNCMVVYVYEKYAPIHTQQTRGIHPMLFQCWSTVFDAGPTLKQHRSGECIVLLGRVGLARCALPPVCAARRESANSYDSRPTQLQITPHWQVGL